MNIYKGILKNEVQILLGDVSKVRYNYFGGKSEKWGTNITDGYLKSKLQIIIGDVQKVRYKYLWMVSEN